MRLQHAWLPALLAILIFFSSFRPVASAAPVLVLQKTWGGISGDYANGVTVDPSTGSIYVTGYTNSFSLSLSRVFLLKYDANGGLVWQRLWNDSTSGIGYAVAVDAIGNIFVTGYRGAYDAFLLKFNSTGGLVWQKIWGGVNTDYAFSVATNSSDSIYVTGSTNSAGAGAADVFLLKYSEAGALLWQRTWGGSGNDQGFGVAVGKSAVYVTGKTNSFGAGGDDALLLKFDSSGNLLWQKTWGGAFTDEGRSDALDSAGNIYVTGDTDNWGAGNLDTVLLKYDTSGNLLWKRTWGGSAADQGNGVAVDSAGNVYVAGSTLSFGAGSFDAMLLKLNSTGALLSQATYGGVSEDSGNSVAVDLTGDAVMVGSVLEAPPYQLSSAANSTLGFPPFTPQATSNVTTAPSLPSTNAAGIATSVTGITSYAGSADAFIIKYYVPSTVATSCGKDLRCSIASNATLSNVNSAGNTIHFTATGAPGTQGYANVTIPKAAVPNISQLAVFLNQTKTPYTFTMNATHYFIFFAFTFHSTYTVDISLAPSLGLQPLLAVDAILTVTVVLLLRKPPTRKYGPGSN